MFLSGFSEMLFSHQVIPAKRHCYIDKVKKKDRY